MANQSRYVVLMTLTSDLAAIRARCEVATPGPWRYRSWLESQWSGSTHHVVETGVGLPGNVVNDASEQDAAFIAHAREDLPRLLARLEEMRGALTEIRQSYCGDTCGHGTHALLCAQAVCALRPLDAPG